MKGTGVEASRWGHSPVTVRMPGGALRAHVRTDWSIRLQGPGEEVYAGSFSPEFMDALAVLEPPVKRGRDQ